MNIIEKKVSDLIPYANNPRHNEDAVDVVAASIREFGFKVPMVIDSNNVVVAGHTRLLAAKSLGMDVVPCIVADDLTEKQIKAFRLADNKTAEKATWDFDMLELELQELTDIDMEQFGFEPVAGTKAAASDGEKDTSFNYQEQYGVIVMCADETEQESVYTRLTEEGYTCKVVAV